MIGEGTIVMGRMFQSEISKPLKVQAEKGLFFYREESTRLGRIWCQKWNKPRD